MKMLEYVHHEVSLSSYLLEQNYSRKADSCSGGQEIVYCKFHIVETVHLRHIKLIFHTN
jgi:hypothetical protein